MKNNKYLDLTLQSILNDEHLKMENLELTTFIIKDKKYSIRDTNKIDSSQFIPITDISQLDPEKLDRDYLDGVLYMKFNGETIMDFTFWGDILDLWHYFINSLEELIIQNESSFSFPSQPLPVSIKIVKDRIRLVIDDKSINMKAEQFLEVMLQEAITFFTALMSLFPKQEAEYHQTILRIYKIKLSSKERFTAY